MFDKIAVSYAGELIAQKSVKCAISFKIFRGPRPPNPQSSQGSLPLDPAAAQLGALHATSLAFFWSLAVLCAASQLWESRFLLPWEKYFWKASQQPLWSTLPKLHLFQKKIRS